MNRLTLPSLSFLFLWLGACAAPAPTALCTPSTGGILLAPTATRPSDPDLFQPPQPPPAGSGGDCGPTATPAGSAAVTPTHFVATDVVNLSLDIEDQALAATAVGDDMMAVAWLTGEDVVVALARGGNHFQVRRVDRGSAVSLAFSRANRLHVVTEQDGEIFYRAADQGTHPADVDPIFVDAGSRPQVVIDELNWAHVLFTRSGRLFKAKHLSGDAWLTQAVTDAETFSAITFTNEQQVSLFGTPAGAYWFGLFVAVPQGQEVRILRYLSWFNLWQQVAVLPLPPDETVTGRVGLAYRTVSADEAWVTAAWVTKRPAPQSPQPLYAQPIFEAVNPLAPAQLANPHHIYHGLNAARWRSDDAPFAAGLRQTVPVTDTGGAITATAWGLAETAVGADMSIQIGLDPTGGDRADSPDVVWSPAISPTTFTPFTVTTSAAGPTATLFLHATLNSSGAPATAVWDAVTVQNAALTNGDFEAAFGPQSTLTVPEGWTAYYRDGGSGVPGSRDVFTVMAAWSADGGASWSAPAPIVANRDGSGGTSGAFRPHVAPVITLETDPPSVSFFTIYEAGDPPPGSDFLRYGRPYVAVCELGTTTCSDSPGAPLLPRSVVRPSHALRVAPDPFNPTRALLAWDGLQADAVSRDVYVTGLALR